MLNQIAAIHGTGVPPTPLTGFVSIATTTVGAGGTPSVTFSAIPSVYKHLQIRQLNLNSAASQTILIRFNSDTGSNYARHQMGGFGTGVFASSESSQTEGFLGIGSGSTSASFVGTLITDILDYSSTAKNTTIKTFGGTDTNGAGQIKLCSTLWMNTAAVSSILIYPDSGNFNEYSSFALYGIEG